MTNQQEKVKARCPRCGNSDFVRDCVSDYGDYRCDLCKVDFTIFGSLAIKHSSVAQRQSGSNLSCDAQPEAVATATRKVCGPKLAGRFEVQFLAGLPNPPIERMTDEDKND